MIDKKNRLFKLLKRSENYDVFMWKAASQAHWYFAPFVAVGVNVDKKWLAEFWRINRG